MKQYYDKLINYFLTNGMFIYYKSVPRIIVSSNVSLLKGVLFCISHLLQSLHDISFFRLKKHRLLSTHTVAFLLGICLFYSKSE